jgi:hypothetical protein
MTLIMAKEIHNQPCQCPETLEELVHEIEKHPDLYQHLRIFLGRESNDSLPDFGDEYLVVNGNGFAV